MRRALVFLLAWSAACAAPRFHRAGVAGDTVVERLTLQWSSAYLVRRGETAVLIDSGSPGDCDDLRAALHARGVRPHAVVITHAHADHAGCARSLQARGAKIYLGAGDVEAAARGTNDPFRPTGLVGAWLAPTFRFPFRPFEPDVIVDRERTVSPGLAVLPAPGHTPGTIVAVLGDLAFAGDLLKGGAFAKLRVHEPSEHYYQHDRAADHAAIQALLDRGVTTLYLGHGGSVSAGDVRAWLADAEETVPERTASIELDVRGELDGATGGLRLRYGAWRPVGLLVGVDLRAGGLGEPVAVADAHVAGISLRSRRGAIVSVTGGVGIDLDAVRAPLELDAELPLGPVRVLARGGVAWRRGEDLESTALLGVRLGRDHRYGDIAAGKGPFLAITARGDGDDRFLGLALGLDLWGGT